jgi:phosphatidylserine decarboxylase
MKALDYLLTLPQYIAPQHGLSQIVWNIARCKNRTLKNALIGAFLARYTVDLTEAARAYRDDYDSFNDFFTRALRPEARPVSNAKNSFVCPADGTISQLGRIKGDSILQAKGRDYSLAALLAGDNELERRIIDGSFATIYLAPHNYHRVHTPAEAKIVNVRYVPGRLFSVNNRTARCVGNLFARNERIIVELETSAGTVVLILVGAMLVGSMELVGYDVDAAIRDHQNSKLPFQIAADTSGQNQARGAEIGRFNMGSTVILLTEPKRVTWDPALIHASEVRVGQAIASIGPQ